MEKSQITGVVKDTQNETLPGVVIAISGPTDKDNRTNVSRADGDFFFRELDPGEYKLTAKMSGFNPYKEDIYLEIGETYRATIVLENEPREEI